MLSQEQIKALNIKTKVFNDGVYFYMPRVRIKGKRYNLCYWHTQEELLSVYAHVLATGEYPAIVEMQRKLLFEGVKPTARYKPTTFTEKTYLFDDTIPAALHKKFNKLLNYIERINREKTALDLSEYDVVTSGVLDNCLKDSFIKEIKRQSDYLRALVYLGLIEEKELPYSAIKFNPTTNFVKDRLYDHLTKVEQATQSEIDISDLA